MIELKELRARLNSSQNPNLLLTYQEPFHVQILCWNANTNLLRKMRDNAPRSSTWKNGNLFATGQATLLVLAMMRLSMMYAQNAPEDQKADLQAFVLELIANPKTDVNARGLFGRTPLMMAVEYEGMHPIVTALLNRNDIEVNQRDDYRTRFYAVRKPQDKCIEYGFTALIYAAVGGALCNLRAILAHPQVDLYMQSSARFPESEPYLGTALVHAQRWSQPLAAELIRKAYIPALYEAAPTYDPQDKASILASIAKEAKLNPKDFMQYLKACVDKEGEVDKKIAIITRGMVIMPIIHLLLRNSAKRAEYQRQLGEALDFFKSPAYGSTGATLCLLRDRGGRDDALLNEDTDPAQKRKGSHALMESL